MSLDLTTTAFGPAAGNSIVSQPAVKSAVPMAAKAKLRGNANMAATPTSKNAIMG